MLLQQLVVELHHSLMLLELQQALAEVQRQRKTHLLQRFQVLRPSVHLQEARASLRVLFLKMMECCGEAQMITE